MKKVLELIVYLGSLLLALGILFTVRGDLWVHVEKYIKPNKYNTIGEVNEYYREENFLFVQNAEQFTPMNKQDILNIYYSAINAGKNEFTFFCTAEFPDCIQVIEEIANDQNILSDINNYVHPFNSFSHIETEYDTRGKVTISIVHTYTKDRIDAITQKMDELAPELIKEDDTIYNNIKRIHDYIIENAEYDLERADFGDDTYQSDTAYGPLIQGKAVCGGYTDLMALYLDRMNIPNFRVSSDKHIWNAVLIDDKWVHLDLTWDDPVYEDGSQQVDHRFFLINTQTLYAEKETEHNFDTNNYPELVA